MERRKIYIDNTPLSEALASFLQAVETAKRRTERLPVNEALGRVTAEPVFAGLSSPHYNAAAMDGIAVKAVDTFGAAETQPRRLKVGEQARFVNTGNPLFAPEDAVIKIEDIHQVDEQTVEITAAVVPWQHVRAIGEDMVAGEMLLPANHTIRPVDLGALLAGGVKEVTVWSKPRVAIIPTGSELVPPGAALAPGKLIEFNSAILSGMVEEWGGDPVPYPIVRDDYAMLKAAVLQAVGEAEIVAVNAGSSAGSEDYTADVLRELGQVLVHGVGIKPGKPVVLGKIRGKPVIGVPGYPVSAALTFELFVKPVVYALQGLALPEEPGATAVMSRQLVSHLGTEEFVQVKLGQVDGKLIATPISRGAGLVTSLVRADGVARIPAGKEVIQAGEKINVTLRRPLEEIAQTVVVIGSHDLCLDVLGSELARRFPGFALSSAHVGSLGGIVAIKRGEAHLAGLHLLDEASGEYNLPYLRRLLPQEEIVLVNLVYREQGFIVPKGNPKGIRGFADLTRVSFVNRQRGAGTRILLDYYLRQEGIAPEEIRGYEREEFTHLRVAAAVAGGTADTGLGILAAARALDLDFVPVTKERYDLAIPARYYETPLIRNLLAVMKSREFREAIGKLGGYDTSRTGEIIN